MTKLLVSIGVIASVIFIYNVNNIASCEDCSVVKQKCWSDADCNDKWCQCARLWDDVDYGVCI